MGTQHPHWFPMLATPNIVTIAEECDCICNEDGPCCCHGNQENREPAKSHRSEPETLMPFEEFDGVDDILAVSHLTEKPSVKKKAPLLRAKTLPAIITPSLSIIQAQLEANQVIPAISHDETNLSTPRLSPSKPRSRRSPSAAGRRNVANEKWQLLVDDDGPSKSPGNSPRNSVSSTGSGTSQTSGNRESKYDHSGSSSQGSRAGLAKLARLLTPREKSVGERSTHGSDTPLLADVSAIRKANSIDSLLDTSSPGYQVDIGEQEVVTPSTPTNKQQLPSSPSVPAKLESHKRSNAPTSPTMPSKLAKGMPVLRQGSMERLIDSGPLTKAERKKLEKVNKFNIDLQALFAAVEHEHVERARSILQSTYVDVNSVNGDGFTPLDIAVMTTNVAMVKLLQAQGAAESPRFPSRECKASHLNSLVREAGRCVEDLGTCVLSAATNGSLSAALLKEKERQLSLWQRRHQLLKRMKTGFDRIRPPDPPSCVQLEVVGTRSLRVKFTEPETAHDQDSIVTKYRVEWSCYEDFSPLVGSQEITDVQRLEVTIPDLTQGTTYFVRVSAGNAKGYSSSKCASPLSATPSSWRDVDENSSRSAGRMGKLDDLFHQIINARPAHAGEIKDLSDTPQQQRRQVRKSIKHLFTSAPKFQKNMKRGVFLACLLFNEDRVVVTAEDTLPILEVDETYPSPLHTDFHWLMKVACTWEDVKTLRQDMEKSHSSSNVHFRSKLLQAVEQMQAALGLQDIGHLFYRPLKDSEGTIVLCAVKYIRDPKSVVTLSVRWMPLHKIQRKRSSSNNDNNNDAPSVNDLLLDSLQEMITYNQVSCASLPRGLYVGYMKLKSSVDVIRAVVPRLTPNVLPHSKVRENPHVSCEEWQWLKSLGSEDQSITPTEIQLKFQKAVSAATNHLLSEMDISLSQAESHRFYDVEVIELSDDVSFLLVLPPVDSVCSVPGQCDDVTTRSDCIPLPVQIFEMIHMTTYQPSFIARYSRLSSILEMDTILAHHAHREAFSSTEVSAAKSRLCQLQEFQTQVDNTWRSMRWFMDVLTFARDKQGSGGIALKAIGLSRSTPDSPNQTSAQHHERQGVEEVDKVELNHVTLDSSASSLSETRHQEIRRCASTSRLQVSGADMTGDSDNDSMTPCPKAHSAERLSSRATNEDNLKSSENHRDSVRSSFTGSLKSLSSADVAADDDKVSIYSKDSACSVSEECKKDEADEVRPVPSPSSSSAVGSSDQSGIIRVYAAYETGLPSGTSVKLHVTPQTTAREVVDLVVKQLNMAVILKGRGGPIYGNSQLQSFCLVAMVGARERCLSDDFQPMKLHSPWIKGKLFVKKKSSLLQCSTD